MCPDGRAPHEPPAATHAEGGRVVGDASLFASVLGCVLTRTHPGGRPSAYLKWWGWWRARGFRGGRDALGFARWGLKGGGAPTTAARDEGRSMAVARRGALMAQRACATQGLARRAHDAISGCTCSGVDGGARWGRRGAGARALCLRARGPQRSGQARRPMHALCGEARSDGSVSQYARTRRSALPECVHMVWAEDRSRGQRLRRRRPGAALQKGGWGWWLVLLGCWGALGVQRHARAGSSRIDAKTGGATRGALEGTHSPGLSREQAPAPALARPNPGAARMLPRGRALPKVRARGGVGPDPNSKGRSKGATPLGPSAPLLARPTSCALFIAARW
jgi:hypothetical protein